MQTNYSKAWKVLTSMIHIDFPNGTNPPDDWLTRADSLTTRLKAAADKQSRKQIISENSGLWGEIKEWLEGFSHGKCWFSEARDTCSYWHVEHFRPKNEAKDPDRDGYWWLAFDFRNYRLCGGVVNVKKGAYFPLKPGTQPATCPEDNPDDEARVLIDPTRKDDVDLITFADGGLAMPAESRGWSWERADKSIKRYKLNDYPPLLRAREKVWSECQRLVDQLHYEIHLRKLAEETGKFSPARDEKIETLKRSLRQMTLPSSQFSGVARAYLLRDTRDWVRNCIA